MSSDGRKIDEFRNALNLERARAWLMLSNLDNRVFAGNDGYADEVEHLYRWDSTVPNHEAVVPGDLVVLWDKFKSIGISRIDHIETGLAVKNRYRCPACRSTKIMRRATKHPTYQCGFRTCQIEFDIPLNEEVGVTTYTAEYGRSWLQIVGTLNDKECRNLAMSPKSQHSMRAINLLELLLLLKSLSD